MEGFELIIWPSLKECSNTDHAHSGGGKGLEGSQEDGGYCNTQLPLPQTPSNACLHSRAMGTGGIPSPLPSFHLLLPPWDPSEPHGIWWPRVTGAVVAQMVLGHSCVPFPLLGESQMSRRTWACGVPGAIPRGAQAVW